MTRHSKTTSDIRRPLIRKCLELDQVLNELIFEGNDKGRYSFDHSKI